ncbi:MAG: hypothetical protein ABIG71_02325 [Candidatus Uhrbacteria bacterium]
MGQLRRYQIIVGILAIALLFAVIAIGKLWAIRAVPPTAVPYATWQSYVSERGFTFRYPEAHAVNETRDPSDPRTSILHVVALDSIGEPLPRPPVLQITYNPDSLVSFSLWEGIPWDGFPTIAETFRMIR